MARPSEEISKATANSNGKTDANLANDSNHLGGIAADEYATKQYVKEYHDSQTEELTETMNRNDNTVLQQAKGYTDAVVGNQDFSGFAKQTDIQTLNTNLTNQINQCKNNCETKINNKASQIVQDVNANFDDVNAAINQLRATDNQLFQSVSNGKSLIAGAITDKGVSTSASDSFSTMANKITQIPTSSGGGGDSDYDENYVNTEDATATADDILLGRTAYIKGEKVWGNHKDLDTRDATANPEDIMYGKSAYMNGIKVYGTYIPLNTSDASASESDILEGETAYVNGQKITGTYVPEEQLDTSDATARPVDILQGATAYVNGQKITGTYVPGISPDDPDVVDTSDATAIANDLLAGKTAYARGEMIIGTYTRPEYLDTNDATAYSSDLRNGVTAYARGQKIVGTMIPEAGGGGEYIEKIYGINPTSITRYKTNYQYPSGGSRRDTVIYDEYTRLPKILLRFSNDNNSVGIYRLSAPNSRNEINETLIQTKTYSELGISGYVYKVLATPASQYKPYIAVASGTSSSNITNLYIIPYEIDNDSITFETAYSSLNSITGDSVEMQTNNTGETLIIINKNFSYSSLNLYVFEIYKTSKQIQRVYKIENYTQLNNITADNYQWSLQCINDKLFYYSGDIYSNNGNVPNAILIILDRYNIPRIASLYYALGISKNGQYLLKQNNTDISYVPITIDYNYGTVTEGTSTQFNSVVNRTIYAGKICYDNVLLLNVVNSRYYYKRDLLIYTIDFQNNELTLISSYIVLTQDELSTYIPFNFDPTNNAYVRDGGKTYVVGDNQSSVVGIKYNGEKYYKLNNGEV